METANPNRELTLTLLVRSQAGAGGRNKQQALIETLAELKQEGVIDAFDIRVCGAEICMQMPTDDGLDSDSIVSLVSQIRDWATDRRVSIEGTFREKTICSAILDEEQTVIKLPQLSLLVFEDGSLNGVYPCHEDGKFCSVEECIAMLRKRDCPIISEDVALSH